MRERLRRENAAWGGSPNQSSGVSDRGMWMQGGGWRGSPLYDGGGGVGGYRCPSRRQPLVSPVDGLCSINLRFSLPSCLQNYILYLILAISFLAVLSKLTGAI